MAGRGEPLETVRGWATGRTWIGARAASLGLIDYVETMDETVQRIRKELTR